MHYIFAINKVKYVKVENVRKTPLSYLPHILFTLVLNWIVERMFTDLFRSCVSVLW